LKNKCTPEQWTSILGTNHKYFESVEYTSSLKALFAVCDISIEHKYVASSIITELTKAENQIQYKCSNKCLVSDAKGETLISEALKGLSTEMSAAGKAKVRYVAGMCVAKLRNSYMNIVIANQNNPGKSVQNNIRNESEKVT
jgi:hypothetical protein